jgi:hypothetical protein
MRTRPLEISFHEYLGLEEKGDTEDGAEMPCVPVLSPWIGTERYE